MADDQTIRVATTLNHFNEVTKTFVEGVKPMETVRLGGAGNKICNLALGNVDTYMFPQYGLKYWDLCAPESIVKGLGGVSYNLK